MSATGLSADPQSYRQALESQPDEQIDAWAAELMRDLSIRRGVRQVVGSFRRATGLSEIEFERVFAVGGGPPAVIGRTAEGELMVPAISLHVLVPGLRAEAADGRRKLIEFIVSNFHEIVFV